MTLGWAHWLIALVALQRLAELVYARRNTAALLQLGAVETGAEHYPLFILLHAAWLAAIPSWSPPIRPCGGRCCGVRCAPGLAGVDDPVARPF